MEEQMEQPLHDDQSAAGKRKLAEAQSGRLRQRMELELQRERILDERTSNPVRRQALAAALADIEAQLEKL